jgi:hypothetical protein
MKDEQSGVVGRLLQELDLPVSNFRDDHRNIRILFEEASEPVAQVLVGDRRAPGEIGFALNQLVTRAFSDVIVSFHLATHGFLNAAYNEVRIAYEACDLIKLIAQDRSQASLWVKSEQPWKEFSPSAVRKKLGEDKVDEVYSHLCSLAHPRFDGADLTGFAYRDESGSGGSHFSIGPSPFIDERPYTAHAMLFIGQTLGKVAVSVGYLVDGGGINETECREMLGIHFPALGRYHAAVIELAQKSGQPGAVDWFNPTEFDFGESTKHQ